MKMLLAGLAIVAVAVGGGVGYASFNTMTSPSGYGSFAEPDASGSDSNRSDSNSPDSNSPDSDTTAGSRVFDQVFGGRQTGSSEKNADAADSTTAGATSSAEVPASEAPAVSEGDVVISESDLNQIVTEAITSQTSTAPILEVAKGVETSIEDDRIESGVTINLSELPTESLPAEGKEAVEQLTSTFPFLANRDVYVGIEGSPTVVDGALSLDNTNIRFGQLRLPVDAVASQLGLSQTTIESQIDALIAQQGITPESVRIENGQIVITGVN